MRFIVAAGSEAEARAWGRRHRVRPCDLLVVEATSLRPAADLAEKAAGVPLYAVPVVRLHGWAAKAPTAVRDDLDGFLASLRPPLVQVV